MGWQEALAGNSAGKGSVLRAHKQLPKLSTREISRPVAVWTDVKRCCPEETRGTPLVGRCVTSWATPRELTVRGEATRNGLATPWAAVWHWTVPYCCTFAKRVASSHNSEGRKLSTQ